MHLILKIGTSHPRGLNSVSFKARALRVRAFVVAFKTLLLLIYSKLHSKSSAVVDQAPELRGSPVFLLELPGVFLP